MADTITSQIAASVDDVLLHGYASEGSGGLFANSLVFVGNLSAGSNRSSSLRFTGITLPSNATITAAKITFVAKTTRSGVSCISKIWGDNRASPAAPTSVATFWALGDYKTVEAVDWTIPAWTAESSYDSPDLSDLIQELITLNGAYVSGVMQFLWWNNGSSVAAMRDPYDYSQGAAKSAVLTITYTTPPGAPPDTVLRSFAAPATSAQGLAWDGKTLWLSDNGTILIYQLDPVTGRVLRSFAAPATNPTGLAWDGKTLWHTDEASELIYQIDPVTGRVLRSFAAPVGGPLNLAWDGRDLLVSSWITDAIYQLDPVSGRVIRTLTPPATSTTGSAFTGISLWVADIGSDIIYEIDSVTVRVIRSFASPSANPTGLAWDGRALWLCSYSPDTIYQLSV